MFSTINIVKIEFTNEQDQDETSTKNFLHRLLKQKIYSRKIKKCLLNRILFSEKISVNNDSTFNLPQAYN